MMAMCAALLLVVAVAGSAQALPATLGRPEIDECIRTSERASERRRKCSRRSGDGDDQQQGGAHGHHRTFTT